MIVRKCWETRLPGLFGTPDAGKKLEFHYETKKISCNAALVRDAFMESDRSRSTVALRRKN
jgi:hypothetical protein